MLCGVCPNLAPGRPQTYFSNWMTVSPPVRVATEGVAPRVRWRETQELQAAMQVLSAKEGVFLGILKDLLQKEGPRALWSGLGARVATIGPSAAITWVVYEEVKAMLVENRIP